jgi:hypothetical protein
MFADTGEARMLWVARSLPSAPWIALAGLCVLALLARRFFALAPSQPFLNAPRLALATLVCTVMFVLWSDRSMSGDFLRVLLDIDRHVWLLKAEPLGPASFQVLAALGKTLGFPPIVGLQWLLALLSSLSVLVTWKLARTLDAHHASLRDLRFVALLGSATSALYFGHIETYTLPTLAMLWYLVHAQRVLSGQGSLRAACVLFALACALHMQMLCLGPSLLVCALASKKTQSFAATLRELGLFGAFPLLVVQLLCLRFPPPYPQYYGGGDQTMLVTLAKLLTPSYWLGVFGVFGTFAPGAFAALGLVELDGKTRRPVAHELVFALALGAPWLAFVLLWNPDLGYARDWDLFAPAGVALTFAALLWPLARLPKPAQALALWAMLLLNVMRSVPLVLANAQH